MAKFTIGSYHLQIYSKNYEIFQLMSIKLNKRYATQTLHADLCLVLPCLGAGHDHSVILGKLRNMRLDCFSQELRELMVELIFLNKNLLFVPIKFIFQTRTL